jgi:predicted nucleic acid-binding protein
MSLTVPNSMTKEAVFLDTNILVAASHPNAPFHKEAIKLADRLHAAPLEVWISRQIVRELLATLSRPQSWGVTLAPQTLADHAGRLLKLYKIAEEGPNSTTRLLEYVRDGRAQGRQVHDAAIAAVMLSHGIKRLLTFNTAHFERFKPELVLEAVGG